jgi:hypothetical protein
VAEPTHAQEIRAAVTVLSRSDRPLDVAAGRLLAEVAATVDDHEPSAAYAGMPEIRWCLGCQAEECDALQVIDAALAVARAAAREHTPAGAR